MIIDKEKIKESIGDDICKECQHFDLDIYTTAEVVQLGCKNEELCAALYGRALDKAADKYYKLP